MLGLLLLHLDSVGWDEDRAELLTGGASWHQSKDELDRGLSRLGRAFAGIELPLAGKKRVPLLLEDPRRPLDLTKLSLDRIATWSDRDFDVNRASRPSLSCDRRIARRSHCPDDYQSLLTSGWATTGPDDRSKDNYQSRGSSECCDSAQVDH